MIRLGRCSKQPFHVSLNAIYQLSEFSVRCNTRAGTAHKIGLGAIDLWLRAFELTQLLSSLIYLVGLQFAEVLKLLLDFEAHILDDLDDIAVGDGSDVVLALQGALQDVIARGSVEIVVLIMVDREVEWHLYSGRWHLRSGATR
ncbi:hypothetical protein PG987_015753 [Apiospora arundinis]